MKTQTLWLVAFVTLLMAGGLGIVPFAWGMSNLIWDGGIKGIWHYLTVMASIIIYVGIWVGSVTLLNKITEKKMRGK
jgi:hypothetical protein